MYWLAQQKVVLTEKFADRVSDERGRRVGFESQRIYSNLIQWNGPIMVLERFAKPSISDELVSGFKSPSFRQVICV